MPERLLVDVARLRRRVGDRQTFERRVVLDEMRVGSIEVVDDTVEVDLELEAIVEGVAVEGLLSMNLRGPCRRCLELVTRNASVAVNELFALDHEPGETYPIGDDDTIELASLVRDATLLALPQLLLCRESCTGPDPERFPTGPGTAEQVADPGQPAGGDQRWAALDELEFD